MTLGKFISLEGGDGSGKSTQLRQLVAKLKAHGIECLQTREPGGCPGAEQIRRLLVEGDVGRWQPLTETLLHYAARIEHVAITIKPALKRGEWVVADRFADSTMAYQGYGLNVERNLISELHDNTLRGFSPDLTIILDVPVEVGLGRVAERQRRQQIGRVGAAPTMLDLEPHRGDRYERMGNSFHERLRSGFKEIAQRDANRCVLIDATESTETVAQRIWEVVTTRFSLK